MTSKQGRVSRAVDRFMSLQTDGHTDERERAVFTEAATFGFGLGIYVNLAVALVAAVLGAVALPAVLLALLAVPSWTAMAYARRHGVDIEALADRAGLSVRLGTLVAVFGGLLLTVGAMAVTVLTGSGLVSLPPLDVIGPEASGLAASLVKGAVIGALGGGLIGLVMIPLAARRRRVAAAATEDEPDEDW